jgi:hypothetical protein
MRQREQDQLGVRYSSSALSGRCQDVESTARRMTNSVPALTRAEQRSGGGGAGAGTDWQTEYEREFRAYEPYRYQTVRRDKAIHVRSPDLLPSTPRIHRSYLSIS